MTSISNVLKCNNCNLVLNELLTFVQNKHEVMDSDSLVRICGSSFSTDDIETAKSLLFESISSKEIRKIKRKNMEGKSNKDLFDIIHVFKSLCPEKIPIFVAQDLNKLPAITFDHVDVSRLLKDLLILQNDIKLIKSDYVTSDQLSLMKDEVSKQIVASCTDVPPDNDSVSEINISQNSYRNINLRRGACLSSFNYDSGPMGLLPRIPPQPLPPADQGQSTEGVNDLKDKYSCECLSILCEPLPSLKSTLSPSCTKNTVREPAVSISPEHYKGLSTVYTNEGVTEIPTERSKAKIPTKPYLASPEYRNEGLLSAVQSAPGKTLSSSSSCSFAEVARKDGDWRVPEKSTEWIDVQRKRYRNRFLGRKGSASTAPQCKFKAAEVLLPLFINNVDKGASSDDIAQYVMNKTHVKVTLEKIIMKQQKDYNAYKIFVPRHKLDLFMDDKIWPEGISFRRFIDFGSSRINKTYYGSRSN